MTMKHISKLMPKKVGAVAEKKKATRPTPYKYPRRYRRAKVQLHPMQEFFIHERIEKARQAKLEKQFLKKQGKKKGKDKGGRPSVIDEIVLAKLEYAFSMDATNKEACVFAGISEDALYDYNKKHPEFTDRIDMLKELPVMIARETITRALKSDPEMAMKYVKNKRNNEFNERKEVKMGGAVKLLPKLGKEEAEKIEQTFKVFMGAVDAVAEDLEDDDDDE
jgi:hypothetical protein